MVRKIKMASYQQFDLDVGTFRAITRDSNSKTRFLISALRDVEAELIKSGHHVLRSDNVNCGLPENIIVGHERRIPREDGFLFLAQRNGLPYSSGTFYTKVEPQAEETLANRL